MPCPFDSPDQYNPTDTYTHEYQPTMPPFLTPKDAAPAGDDSPISLVVGVLALQGSFADHLAMLAKASLKKSSPGSSSLVKDDDNQPARTVDNINNPVSWTFVPVRTSTDLTQCDALIIPGGESSAIGILARRDNLLDHLRRFVRHERRPVWGTCAGSILLCDEIENRSADKRDTTGKADTTIQADTATATTTATTNVDVNAFRIGGLAARARRNFFGRQVDSSVRDLDVWLPDYDDYSDGDGTATWRRIHPFSGIFIRAPVLDVIEPPPPPPPPGSELVNGTNTADGDKNDDHNDNDRRSKVVQVLSRVNNDDNDKYTDNDEKKGRPVAMRQGNVFATCFHPELGDDDTVHRWWLGFVKYSYGLGR